MSGVHHNKIVADRCVDLIDRAETAIEDIDLTVDIGEVSWRRFKDGWAICILDARKSWVEAAEANISLRIRAVELIPQLIEAARKAQATMLDRADTILDEVDAYLKSGGAA